MRDTLNYIIKFIQYKIENLSIFFVFHPFKIIEFKKLLKNVKIRKNDIILDIGCGNGFETLLIGKKCNKIYGIDIFKENLDIALARSFILRHKIKSIFFLTTLEDANFKTNCFDKIFSICVLEHISNYDEVLKETHRILKKGGQIIFSVDTLETIEDINFLRFHKKRYKVEVYFKEHILRKLLEEIGFKNIKIFPICKSEYLKKRFMKMMINMSKIDNLVAPIEYFKFKKIEARLSNHKKGLFFIVKCNK